MPFAPYTSSTSDLVMICATCRQPVQWSTLDTTEGGRSYNHPCGHEPNLVAVPASEVTRP